MDHFHGKRLVLVAAVASLLTGSVLDSSAGPAETCRSKQIAAAGKICSMLLKTCYGAGSKTGLPLDRICMGDAQVKLIYALDGIEGKATCDFEGLDMPVWDRLCAVADNVAVDQLSYLTGGVCAAKKLKAAAKKCQAYTKCYATAAKEGALAPDRACLLTASTKFSETLAKIESVLTCTPADNADAIETLIDVAIADVSTVFTSGTTTTTTLPH